MRTKLLYSSEQIKERIDELGAEIDRLYAKDEPILCICVLKGAFMFFSELVRRLSGNVVVDFITLSSYTLDKSGEMKLIGDIRETAAGKHILIVEDIVDSGRTVEFLRRRFLDSGALSVKVACLLDRPSGRKTDVSPDYAAFTMTTPEFVVGFGLDYDQHYRNLDCIMEVCFDE